MYLLNEAAVSEGETAAALATGGAFATVKVAVACCVATLDEAVAFELEIFTALGTATKAVIGTTDAEEVTWTFARELETCEASAVGEAVSELPTTEVEVDRSAVCLDE